MTFRLLQSILLAMVLLSTLTITSLHVPLMEITAAGTGSHHAAALDYDCHDQGGRLTCEKLQTIATSNFFRALTVCATAAVLFSLVITVLPLFRKVSMDDRLRPLYTSIRDKLRSLTSLHDRFDMSQPAVWLTARLQRDPHAQLLQLGAT